MPTTEERLTQLEALFRVTRLRGRLLTCLWVLAFFAMAGVWLLGVASPLAKSPATPEEIRAKGFVLEGDHGEVRAELVGSDSFVGLYMQDPKGERRRLALVVQNDSADILVVDSKDQKIVSLGVTPHDEASLTLRSSDGAVSARTLVSNGRAGIGLFSDKQRRFVASTGPDDSEYITLFNAAGHQTWTAAPAK